jgi:hypothetical protein
VKEEKKKKKKKKYQFVILLLKSNLLDLPIALRKLPDNLIKQGQNLRRGEAQLLFQDLNGLPLQSQAGQDPLLHRRKGDR